MSSRFAALMIALLLQLAGCEQKSTLQIKYEEMIPLRNEELRNKFQGLSPSEQIDVYLYGVNKIRPRDYSFAPQLDLTNPSVVRLLTDRLRSADSEAEIFALVYALHGVTSGSLAKADVAKVIGARKACDRFFTSPSPCHQLAGEIDALASKGTEGK